MKPDGSVLMFQGGFERDTILKLLNEAHALGSASKTGGEGWVSVKERLPEQNRNTYIGPHGKRRGPEWRLPCCYGLAYPLLKPLVNAGK